MPNFLSPQLEETRARQRGQARQAGQASAAAATDVAGATHRYRNTSPSAGGLCTVRDVYRGDEQAALRRGRGADANLLQRPGRPAGGCAPPAAQPDLRPAPSIPRPRAEEDRCAVARPRIGFHSRLGAGELAPLTVLGAEEFCALLLQAPASLRQLRPGAVTFSRGAQQLVLASNAAWDRGALGSWSVRLQGRHVGFVLCQAAQDGCLWMDSALLPVAWGGSVGLATWRAALGYVARHPAAQEVRVLVAGHHVAGLALLKQLQFWPHQRGLDTAGRAVEVYAMHRPLLRTLYGVPEVR